MVAAMARGIVAVIGVAYVVTALGLLAAPKWFYDNVGTFPPYNRHYEGDAGAFLLGLGLALVVASRDVARFRAIVLVGAAATIAHAANHAYDAVGESLGQWLADVAPHVVLAALLLWAAYAARAGSARLAK